MQGVISGQNSGQLGVLLKECFMIDPISGDYGGAEQYYDSPGAAGAIKTRRGQPLDLTFADFLMEEYEKDIQNLEIPNYNLIPPPLPDSAVDGNDIKAEIR